MTSGKMVIGMYPASLDILACKGLISVFGLLYLLPEHTIFAQIQKNLMPKQSPNRFIRTGLYGQGKYVSLMESKAFGFKSHFYHDSCVC